MADIEEIADRTAAGIALAYRSGEAGPVAVVECLLDRIEQSRDDNIFITVTPERALTRGRRRPSARYRPGAPLSALDGVPIGWKDLIDVAGTPTTAGSTRVRRRPVKTARPAPVVANAASDRHGDARQAQHDRVRLFRASASTRTTARRAIPNDRDDRALARRLVVGLRRGGRGEARCPAPSARTPAVRCASRPPTTASSATRPSLGRIDTTGRRPAGAELRHDRPAGPLGRGLRPARPGAPRRRRRRTASAPTSPA